MPIIEPTIKSNFERGYADAKTFESGSELKELIKEKENFLKTNLSLENENKKLKEENKKLKAELESKKKKGGE